MSDEIFFDGVRYISAAEAASDSDLTRDYVARLCRDGKVKGRRVGKNWYAQKDSLDVFLISQHYSRSKRHEDLAESRAREYRELNGFSAPPVKGRAAARESVMRTEPHTSEHRVHAPISARVSAAREMMTRAASKHHDKVAKTARSFSSHAGLSDAAVRLASAAHVPAYTVTPFGEFVHKLVALTLAFMMTFGTYALVDPQFARFAIESSVENVQSIAHSYREVTRGGIGHLADSAQASAQLAVENPRATLASAASFLPQKFAALAKALNGGVDHLVYAVAFPDELVNRYVDRAPGASVAVEIQPYARPLAGNDQAPSVPSTKQAQNQTIIQNPVTERVIERTIERIVPQKTVAESGGITEDLLEAKLNQLENKLSSQIYSLSSANSTAIVQSYSVTAQSNAINSLSRVAIDGSTITGGSITDADISGGSISGARISGGTVSATSLTVSGTSTLATTTVTGNLSATGTFTVGGLSSFSNASTSLLSVHTKAYFGGTATTTIDSAGNILGTGTLVMGTSTLGVLSAGTTTLTNLSVTNTSTSTFAGGLTVGGSVLSIQQSNGRIGVGTSTPASIFDIYGTDALRLPVGTSAQRPSQNGIGQVRYNVTTHQFEGYGDNSVWQGLGGVIDADQDTYITADTNNADEDTLRFVTFGTERMTVTNNGQVGIGTTSPVASAQVQIDSTTRGFLPPRLTTAQKNAIASPNFGLVVYDTDLNKLNVYNGSVWKNVGSTEIAGEVTNGTANSVLFVDQGTLTPVLEQDNANFNYASSTHRLLVLQASSTRLSVFDKAYFGGTATTSISSTGAITTPSNFTLSGTAANIVLGSNWVSGDGGDEGVFVNSSGNVGIGTASPYTNKYLTLGSGGQSPTADANGIYVDSPLGGGFFMGEADTSAQGKYEVWDGRMGVGTMTNHPMDFWTNNLQRMTILETGNVGVNDTTPSQLLDIDGTNPQALIEESTTEFLRVGVGETAGTSVIGWDDADSLRFGVYASPTDTTIADLVTILSGGNVGIGTTSPWKMLSVAGDIIGTNITATGTLAVSGLTTFTGGFLSNASSTITSGLFTASGGASTTNITASGTGYFATATTTALNVSGTTNLQNVAASSLLYNDASRNLAAATVGSSLTFSAGALSLNTGNANSWTALQQFSAASTTLFSAYGPAYFGATATSSFDSTGALTLVNALTYGGVTLSNAVTGTGNMVLSASPTLTGTLTAANGTFSGTLGVTGQTTLVNASTTALSVSGTGYFGTASTTNLTVSSLTANRIPYVAAAGAFTDSANLTFDGSALALTGSATISSTLGVTGLATFATGFVSQASSTIGNGTQIGGLTVSGGATTTGNAAFTATTGTTTIAAGQGFTIGGSQFALQQGSGKVGLGTTIPGYKLEINSTGTGGNAAAMTFNESSVRQWVLGAGLTTSGKFSIQNGSNSIDAITIDGSSNVGVGTTTPWGKLSVTGAGTGTGVNFVLADSANSPIFKVLDNGSITATGAFTSTATGANTFPYASSTAISVSGTGYFGSASTTNLTVSSLTANRVPYVTTAGAFTDSANFTFDGTTLTAANLTSSGNVSLGNATTTNLFSTTASSTNLFAQTAQLGSLTVLGGTTYNGLATFGAGFVSQSSSTVAGNFTTTGTNAFTGASNFTGLASFTQASTTRLSVFDKAYFGGSATTTIDSAGNVAVAGTLNVTGNTTLSNATTTNLFSTTASSTNLFAQAASVGTLAASGAATFASTLGVTGLSTFAGLVSTASSTIGAGGQATGLTVSGGATTTGNTIVQGTGTSTYAGNLSVAGNFYLGGNFNPSVDNTSLLGTSTLRFKEGNFGPSGVNVWNVGGTSNYERGSLAFSSNVLKLSTAAPVGGNFRDIQIAPGTSQGLYLSSSGGAGLGYTSLDASIGSSLVVNGRVGIGTTSPSGPLTVSLNGRASGDLRYGLQLVNTDSANTKATNIALLGGGGSGAATGNWFIGTDAIHDNSSNFFIATSTGATAYKQWVFNGEGTFTIGDTTAPATPTNKLYSVGGALYWNSVALNGSVVNYWTRSGTSVLLNTNTDNVGIGATTTAGARLSVAGAAGGTAPLLLISSSTAAFATTTVFQIDSGGTATLTGALLPGGTITNNLGAYDLGATGSRWNALWAGALNIGTSTFSIKSDANSNLGIFTAASGGGTQAVTVTSAGLVGIGTAAPDSGTKLQVAGGILTSSAFSSTVGSTGGIDYSATGLRFFSMGASGATKGTFQWFAKGADGSSSQPMTIDNAGNLLLGATSANGLGLLQVNGNIAAGPGTVGAPGYMFYPTGTYGATGMYSPAANTVGFVTGGGERMRIDSSGNVGIGTVSPLANLEVAGGGLRVQGTNSPASGSGTEILYQSGEGYVVPFSNRATSVYAPLNLEGSIVRLKEAGTTVLTVDGGSVGIGTTTPGHQFDIYGATPRMRIFSTGTESLVRLRADGQTTAKRIWDMITVSDVLKFRAVNDGETAVTQDNILVLQPTGNVGIGTASPNTKLDVSGSSGVTGTLAVGYTDGGCSWATQSDKKFSVTDSNDRLSIFQSTGNQMSLQTFMDCTSSSFGTLTLNPSGGNVGIGTTTPSMKLDVYGGNMSVTNSSPRFDLIGTEASGKTLSLAEDAGILNIGWLGNATLLSLNGNSGNVIMGTSGLGGNVGIGTSTPSAKLDVWTTSAAGDAFLGGWDTNGNYNRLTLNGLSGTGNYNILSGLADQNLYLNVPTGKAMKFRVNNADMMVMDQNGNVGIGTTSPVAHDASAKATVQIGNNYVLQDVVGTQTNLANNAYYSAAGWKNMVTDASEAVRMFGGEIRFEIAASSAAGSTLTNWDATGLGGVVGKFDTSGNFLVYGSGTTCTIGSGTGATNCTSDSRLKANITPISGADALAGLAKINGVTFNWADPRRPQDQQVGVIAQDVQQAFPQLVSTATTSFMGVDGEYYTVDYAALVSPLIAGVNELNTRVDSILNGTATSTITNVAYQSASTTATDTLCLGGDCRTAWPAVATTTDLAGYAMISDLNVATTTLSASFNAALVASAASFTTSLGNATSSLDASLTAHESRLSALEAASSTYATNAALTAWQGNALTSLNTATSSLAVSFADRLAAAIAAIPAATSTDLSGYATLSNVSGLVSTTTLASTLAPLEATIQSLSNGATSTVNNNYYSTSTYAYATTTNITNNITYATTTTADLSNYITFTDLSGYISTSTLASGLDSLRSDLGNYALRSDLGSLVSSSTLSTTLGSYITFADLPSPITLASLSGTVTGNILPQAHNTYDLGTNENRFANIYAQNIHAGDLTFTETTSAISGEAFAAGDIVSLYVTSTGANTATIPINLKTAINSNPWNANNIFFNTSGSFAIGVASTTAPRGKLDVEGTINSGDSRFLTLANNSVANGNAALPYSFYIPSTTGDLNIASNDNGNGSLVNTSYSAWDIALGGQSDTFAIKRSGTGSLSYSSLLNVTSAGKVGIASSTPNAKFAVQGTSGQSYPLLDIASSTGASLFSIGNLGAVSVSGAITSTATGANTFPYASSTALTVSGTGYFGTASTTNLTVSSLTSGRIPYITTAGAFTDSSSLTFDGTTLTTPRGAFSSTSGTTTIASGQGFTIGSSQFVLQQGSGNVGIGTASPAKTLSVAGTGYFTGNVGIGGVSANAGLEVYGTTLKPGVAWGTGAAYLSSNESMAINLGGTLAFGGNYTGTTNTDWAAIVGWKENATDNNTSGYLGFYTKANGGSATEKMRITSAGNVGIGDTSPESIFQVTGGVDNTPSDIGVHLGSVTGFSSLQMYDTAGALLDFNTQAGIDYDFRQIFTGSTGVFGFHSSTTSNILTMDRLGNVGMGVAAPLSNLHVNYTGTGNGMLKATQGILIDNIENSGLNEGPGISFGHFSATAPEVVGRISTIRLAYPAMRMAFMFRAGGSGIGDFATTDERMTILSGGNVGIGTTTPPQGLSVQNGNIFDYAASASGVAQVSAASHDYASSFKSASLVFQGGSIAGNYGYNTNIANANLGALQFLNVANVALATNVDVPITFSNAGVERMRIHTGGNVGIGQTSPDAGLHVSTVTATGQIGAHVSSATGGHLLFTDNGNVDMSLGVVDGQSALSFHTGRNPSSAGTELMRLTSTGNVGIGTTSPMSRLAVVGAGEGSSAITDSGSKSATLLISSSAGSGGDGGQIQFGAGAGSYTQPYFSGIKGILTSGSNNTTGDLAFFTRNATTDSSLTERMRIMAGGNVGIGAAPAATAKLYVRSATDHNLYVRSNILNSSGIALQTINDAETVDKGFEIYANTAPVVIGGTPIDFYISNAFKARLDSSGNLGIGTTGLSTVGRLMLMFDSSTQQGISIQTSNASVAGAPIKFSDSAGAVNGSITYTASQAGVAYNTTSDRRVKENIVDTNAGLSTLMQIPVRDFSFKSDSSHALTQGFIAQELYNVYPYAVSTNGDNGEGALGATSTPWGVDYGRLTPLLARSIQELNTKVDSILNGTATSTITNVAYQNASTTVTDTLCLGGECRSSFASGGISTSSVAQMIADAATATLASSTIASRADLAAATSTLNADIAAQAETIQVQGVTLAALNAASSSYASASALDAARSTFNASLDTATSSLMNAFNASLTASAAMLVANTSSSIDAASTTLAAQFTHQLDAALANIATSTPDMSGYAKLTDIPSVAGFASKSDLASATSSLSAQFNAAIADISIPNVSGLATKDELAAATTTFTTALGEYAKTADMTALLNDYALKSDLTQYAKLADLQAVASSLASALAPLEATTQSLSNGVASLQLAWDSITATTTLLSGGILAGSIFPASHNTYDLGTNDNRFANIYAQNIHAGDLTFTETTSAVSGEALVAGDIVSLYVTSTGANTATVPINLKTAINSNPWNANNIFFNTSGSLSIGIASTTAPRGKLDVEGTINSGDSRFLTLANNSVANGNAALPYSFYIPSTTGDLNIASNDNGNGSLVNSSYSAWNVKLGGQTDAFAIQRSPTGTQSYSNLFNVTSAGKVGISSSTPNAKFAVQGTAGQSYPLLDIASSTGASLFSISNLGAATLSSTLGITGAITSTATGANTFPYASSTALSVSGTGYFGLGQFTNTSGTTTIASGQGFTIGGSQFVLQQGSGNVGIGTASPGTKLTVSGGFLGLVYNGAGVYPGSDDGTAANPVFTVGTNFSNGGGEVNLWNTNTSLPAGFSFMQKTGASAATTLVRMLGNGNVGIGTASPDMKLTVGGDMNISDGSGLVIGHTAQITSGDHGGTTSSIPEFQMLGTARVDSTLMLGSFNSSGAYANAPGPGLTLFRSKGGAVGTVGAVASGDFLGEILWKGDDGTDFKSNAASIYAEVDGTPGTGDMPGRLVFATTLDGAEQATERMRITNAGNVGIGKTPGAYRLDVSGFIHTDDDVSAGGINVGSFGHVIARQASDGSMLIGGGQANIVINAGNPLIVNNKLLVGTTTSASLLDVIASTGGGNYLVSRFGTAPAANSHAYTELVAGNGVSYYATQFKTANNGTFSLTTGATPGTYGTDRLTIDTSGNVGIGTASPANKLQVAAGIVTTGAVLADGASQGGMDYSGGNTRLLSWGADTSTKGTFQFTGVTSNGSANAVRMAIDSSGNVGIGTASPAQVLHIAGTSATTTKVLVTSVVDGENGFMVSPDGVTNGINSRAYLFMGGNNANHSGYLRLRNGNSDITQSNISMLNAAGTTLNYITNSGSSYFNAGNVGIGNTTPYTALAMPQTTSRLSWGTPAGGAYTLGSSGGGALLFGVNSDSEYFAIETHLSGTGHAERFRITEAGNVGVGTSSPANLFSVAGDIYQTGNFYSGTNAVDVITNQKAGLTIATGGLLRGTVSANPVLSVSRMTSDGEIMSIFRDSTKVGSISVTASATAYNTSSDRRVKENIATTTMGLSTLMQIPVREFDFINDPTHAKTQGFIAQELNAVYPYAVTTNGDNGEGVLGATSTPWSVDYGRLTPLLAKAIQDLNFKVEDLASTTPSVENAGFVDGFFKNLFANVTRWFADAANGIGDFFAGKVHTKELCVSKSDGTEICVTGDQLAAAVAGTSSGGTGGVSSPAGGGDSSGSGSTSSTPPATGGADSSAADTEAPVITVSGENPATIDIGAAYSDLGATVFDAGSPNIGITASVDGGAEVDISAITIDTSVAGDHTITYSATDAAGNTGTATRTVHVVDPNATSSSTSTTDTTTTDSTTTSTPLDTQSDLTGQADTPAPSTSSTNTTTDSTPSTDSGQASSPQADTTTTP